MSRRTKEIARRAAAKAYQASVAGASIVERQFEEADTEFVESILGLERAGMLKPDVNVAWHKSGHAVAMELTGLRVRSVTCVPSVTTSNAGIRVAGRGATVPEGEGRVVVVGDDPSEIAKYILEKAAGAAVDKRRVRKGYASYQGDLRLIQQILSDQPHDVGR